MTFLNLMTLPARLYRVVYRNILASALAKPHEGVRAVAREIAGN